MISSGSKLQRRMRVALTAIMALLPMLGWGAQSTSLLLSPDRHWLYSANFDGGSITRINRADPQQRLELPLGKDLQRLAMSDDGRDLLVSDYRQARLYLVDAKAMRLRQTIAVGQRPFGIVYDPQHDWFWVTLFEAAKLLAVTRDGHIALQLPTADTPRGLALTQDGRLLVTHAMLGQVSIYDVTGAQPKLLRRIALAESEDADEFVAQGLPRLLDDIALSPDESEAWLPHVLWNFDHPFQFQSTVFPAVSVLDLTPGAEAERVTERKMLFKQINLLSNSNRTLIVSNPFAAAFSADGNKVYVTAAASEDLLVFDRSRASGASHKRSKRRAGKLDQGGAQVTQILRHLPGANPRGLLVDGNDILVQNAMSLDLSLIDRGGDSAFARARVTTASWAQTVAQDPLPTAQRAGETLFERGNTARDPQHPMAGDNWMSCSSCHLDGFNFTNAYLMDADRQHKTQNALTGHAHLGNMVAGDFLADYIRMVQDAQGGFGHDQRDGAATVDPQHPPPAVLQQMRDLHQYVTAADNLPFLATWLRLDSKDAFAHPEDWTNSAACRSCHHEIFEQWADSNHRLMAASNPYYRVLEDLAGKTEGEGFRAWCSGCHNPTRLSLGQPFHGTYNHMLEQGGVSLQQALQTQRFGAEEGTGCVFCHRVTKLEAAGGNAAMTINLQDRQQYVFENSGNAVTRWLGERQINAKPEVHKASYSKDFYKESRFCGSCHDEFSPGQGAKIVGTFEEWQQSSFNNPQDPSRNRSCQDCHMHADPARIGTALPGRSTDGGPLKANVVTHQFSGANHFLAGLRNPNLDQLSQTLLKTAARLQLRADAGGLVVRVRNVGAGHALPTGVADFRQFWLQLQVRDAAGNLILSSGVPDAQGRVPDEARQFRKVFGDEQGQPVGLKFWRYAKLLQDTRIPADGYRDEAFSLPTDARYPLQVEVKLLFRIYPKWVTDLVQQQTPELPEPPILTLQSVQQQVTAPGAL